MRDEEFRIWLQKLPMNKNPMKDCISRCRKVEKALSIDLDKEYEKVTGNFNFKPDAKIRFRFCDLRVAVKKYFSFCQEKDA